jgi:poly-beta-1,6-N-acetyl-D-glucosamine synthase
MLFFLILISLSYCFLIGGFIYGWQKLPVQELKQLPPSTKFSIIIPFRNEATNLPALLDSIKHLSYPAENFEVLLVDDDSEDESRKLCQEFSNLNPEININVLENFRQTNSPKKDAITTAIEQACHDYILTTDADCELPINWLQSYNEEILSSNSKLVAAPVGYLSYSSEKKYLHAFQEMDFMSLQLAGAGAFGLNKAFLCNGANLCYCKDSFIKMNGFNGNEDITSGDDVFLLQKFVEQDLKVSFIKSKEAIVLTQPQPDIGSLISQRIRWAAKSSAYTSNFSKITGIIVLLMNLCLVIGAITSLLGLHSYYPILLAFLLKFNIDFVAIYKASQFFKREEVLRNYFWCSIIYPFFTVYIALSSLFVEFEWKGRYSKK